MMQKRKLGTTDMNLTVIGFGAWAIGGGNWEWGWGPQDDADSTAAIHKALDLGINWIDTAAAYGLGHSEEMIGKALQGKRDQVYLATKCSLVWEDPSSGLISHRLKAWSVRQEIEDSLRRLKTDLIDLYQIHWPIPEEEIEEGWAEIARLVQEGKVRHAGVSNFNLAQLKRVHSIHPVASLQPQYSLLDRQVEADLLDYCQEQGIGVVAYSPMASGLLTGKYDRQRVTALPPEDWRVTRSEHFQEPALSANLEFIEKLEQVARGCGRSLGELAVAWVLRRPEVTAAIVGARRPDQIAQIAPAGDWNLDPGTISEIDALLEERQSFLSTQTPA
jgi:aryl-alcohol dehydrogenase-like predicted oxidoreductase